MQRKGAEAVTVSFECEKGDVDDWQSHSERSTCEQHFQFAQIICAVSIPALLLLCILDLTVRPQPSRTNGGTAAKNAAETCDTPFGSVIGVAHGVVAYSNCNSDFTSNESNFINLTTVVGNQTVVIENFYTGMPWQCVEYGRRFWALTDPPATFGSVNGASDIWTALTSGYFLEHTPDYSAASSSSSAAEGGSPFPLLKFPNGATNETPRVGDLIIYPIQPGGFPYGHVAAIVDVVVDATPTATAGSTDTAFSIHVGEQNWDSHLWANVAANYSRAIRGHFHQVTGLYSLYDPYGDIAGWVRRQTPPPS